MDPNGATLPTPGGIHPGSRTRAVAPIVLVAAVIAVAVGAVVARSVRRVAVVGGSMHPTLREGDRLVVVVAVWGRCRLAPGDVVALRDPREPWRVLVKRVAAVDRAADVLEVRGDAPDASTDSRTFGPVPMTSVVGRVVYRYGPPGRSGPLPRPTGYDRE